MTELITALTMIFVAASILLFLLDRFSHPAIPAYILAGILVSGFIDTEQILALSQLGIAFLVFVFGARLEPQRLKTVARESQYTTTIQASATGIIAYVAAFLLGYGYINALYFSIAAALSSSLVGLQIIEEDVHMDLIHGRLAESIQLIQDIIAIAAVLVLSASVYTLGNVLSNIAVGVSVIILGLFIRGSVFDGIAKMAEGSQELLMFISLALLAGFTALTGVVEVSIVVGSFTAGLAVAKFPHNLEILDTVGSLKDFFSAIFFVSLGALVSLPTMEVLLMSGILFFLTVILKPLVTAFSLMRQGFDSRTAYLTGFSLDQVSEFALIIAITAFIGGNIDPAIFQSIVLVATASMITSSYSSRHEEKLYQRISRFSYSSDRKIGKRSSDAELEDHVIVVGYDTQGRRLVEALKNEDQEFIVIENDPEKIKDLKENNDNYVFGDVMDAWTWRDAGAEKAELVISTVPLKHVSNRILALDTDADVILRASTFPEASRLLSEGAIYANVSKVLAAEQLVDHVIGVMQNRDYREELRRRNLLEVRRYLESREG